MNKTNFNQIGGFPLKTERLQEFQTTFQIFNAFGALAGNYTIISGCETIGSTVKKGFIYINGELLEFREAGLTGTSKVIIIEEPVNRAFEDGSVKNVYTIRYATFGTAATSWLWTDFKRPIETKTLADVLYAKADRSTVDNVINRLINVETKLATIAPYAEVNVQADMNVTDSTSDAFVKNKSVGDILYKGSLYIGDFSGAVFKPVSFPDVGTDSYIVLGSMRTSNSNDNQQDPTQIWVVHGLSSTGFSLILREIGGFIQSLSFDYVIIKK